MNLRKSGANCPYDAGGLMRRGVLALVVLLLACVLMAGAVSADATSVTTPVELKAALEAGQSVILGNDLSLTYSGGDEPLGTIIIPNGETVTLDLAGHTITATNEGPGTPSFISIGTSEEGIGTTSLTVTGAAEKGGITTDVPSDGKGYTCTFFVQYGSLTIENGVYFAHGYVVGTNGASDPTKRSKNVKITLNGGSYTSTDDVVFYLPGENTQFTMNGGTIETNFGGVEIRSGTCTIDGGTIIAKGAQPDTINNTAGATTNTGAAIAMTWRNCGYKEPTKVYIKSGSVTSTNGTAILNAIESTAASADYAVAISGGTIAGNKAVYATYTNCKEITPSITGGTFVVSTPEGLKNALELGGTDYTVKVGSDITGTAIDPTSTDQRILIAAGTPTLDLGTSTITTSVSGSSKKIIPFITVTGTGKLTVGGSGKIKITGTNAAIFATDNTNGEITINSGNYESSYANLYINNASKCTINGGTFTADFVCFGVMGSETAGTPTFIFNDGTATSKYYVISGNGLRKPVDINVHGGTLTSNEDVAIYMPAMGNLKITGGTISGKTGVEMRTATLTMSGGTITGTDTWTEVARKSSDGSLEKTGAGLLLVKKLAYQGSIVATISGGTITSNNGAAIANYVTQSDLNSGESGPSVTINDNVIVTGKRAAIANEHYSGESTSTIVGTFSLNGGIYKGDEILKNNPSVTYPTDYSMTKQADANGYHFVTKIVEPEIKEEVKTDSNTGKTTISAPSGSTLDYNEASKTVTMKDTTSGVTLEVAYGDDAQKTGEAVSGTVNSITAKYEEVDLAGPSVSLDITLEGTNPAEVKNTLPSIIKSVKVDIVKTSLSADYNNVQILTMFEALSSDISKFNEAIKDKGIVISFKIPVTAVGSNPVFSIAHFNANGGIKAVLDPDSVVKDGDNWIIKATAKEFSGYAPFTGTAKSSGYSSSGNMNNAFRVLFDTQGGSYVSPATSLSYGDKISQPPAPTKDGYTFGGWYKDSACTQEWNFSDSIPGDMTLYAKWTSAAGAQAEATATTAATATATEKATTAPVSTQSQSTSATTAAPVSTTAAGSQPTLTQAPAPVLGALLGLLAAGVLIRRRD